MDKKSLAIVVILGVVLIGIIVAAFVYDGAINTTILEVNGTKYDKKDFESYLKVWQYENGEEAVEMDTMFSQYQVYKLYSQYVDKYGIELPSGEKVTVPEEADITKLAEDYNLSKDEYMKTKTEIATVDYLFANLQDYWHVSDADYEEHKGENADKFKMYDYRIMQVSVEQPKETSGDISGDASGDVSGDNSEQARKDAAKSRAVEALAKVKSGDSFEEVAKEYGTNRITYNGSGYSVVNGNIESVSGLYMEDYIYEEDVLSALTTLKVGEYSEIYDNDTSYMFVYLENIREGLDEADDNTYRRQIANEHIQGEARVVSNKITLKSIDLEKLIPALIKVDKASGDVVEDEHNHEHTEDASGEEIEDAASGELNETVGGEEN